MKHAQINVSGVKRSSIFLGFKLEKCFGSASRLSEREGWISRCSFRLVGSFLAAAQPLVFVEKSKLQRAYLIGAFRSISEIKYKAVVEISEY